jgi:hypothetical protein
MKTLDALAAKFQEVKEELNKAAGLHDTLEGFMGALKATPKGSPERGKLITSHMNHAPFVAAVKAHPQGAQVSQMLNNHLNSKANAGFKPGMTSMIVKSDTLDEDLDKALTQRPRLQAEAEAANAHFRNLKTAAPAMAPHPKALPSPEEHADRAASYANFMPAGKFQKDTGWNGTVNGSLAMSAKEKITLSKGGQWNLENTTKAAPVDKMEVNEVC